MTDWKAVAQFRIPDLPPGDVLDVSKALEAMESAFQPLLKDLTDTVEPAVVLAETAVLGQ